MKRECVCTRSCILGHWHIIDTDVSVSLWRKISLSKTDGLSAYPLRLHSRWSMDLWWILAHRTYKWKQTWQEQTYTHTLSKNSAMLWKRIKWMEGVENWRKYLDAFASRRNRYTSVQIKTRVDQTSLMKMRIDHIRGDGRDNPNVLYWLFTYVHRYIFSRSLTIIEEQNQQISNDSDWNCYLLEWSAEQRTACWPSLAAWHIEPTDSNLQHSIDRDSVSRSLSAIRLYQTRGLTKQLSAQMLRNERATSSNYESIVTSGISRKTEGRRRRRRRRTSIRLCIWKERALEKDQSTSR